MSLGIQVAATKRYIPDGATFNLPRGRGYITQHIEILTLLAANRLWLKNCKVTCIINYNLSPGRWILKDSLSGGRSP
jgi:hypothetical protein